jgi:hypothetical protein
MALSLTSSNPHRFPPKSQIVLGFGQQEFEPMNVGYDILMLGGSCQVLNQGSLISEISVTQGTAFTHRMPN